ncbi:ABC transporter ATP-binding protein [bacterium]|nr:ABC transporter ATP-binding protein [candidate division CSSED10-310 bacterium]
MVESDVILNATAVEIQNIGKKYRTSVSRKYQQPKSIVNSEIWVLRNVSVKILKGEIFGIVGPNGAGKSTLLKILSKVTSPSEGSFHIEGRVNALLELGTGFHPELSGYENLFIGAALQGVKKAALLPILDKIIAFADIGDAVFQPIRTYSSGMYLRLAFSLAIHLKPDVLILDEIIAVGDDAFQKKCFSVIRHFQQEGVTILFVSHDLKLVSLLCQRAMLLDEGTCLGVNTPRRVLELYNRRRSRGIAWGNFSIHKIDSKFDLYHNNSKLTGALGLYTSFRCGGIWYDSLRNNWHDLQMNEKIYNIEGWNNIISVRQQWAFRIHSDETVEWTVQFQGIENIKIERIQVNVMLHEMFSEWRTGSDQGSFPLEFDASCGEDWTRLWIGSPDGTATAESGELAISFSVSAVSEGALAVVNSHPDFRGRVLQYILMIPPSITSVEKGWQLTIKGLITTVSRVS